MQELRGAVYLEEGAIGKDQLIQGRHHQACDSGSWHLLVLDQKGEVCGCARYREYLHDINFETLSVSRSAIANCSTWGDVFRSAVNNELALSRRLALPYVELGGWALLEEVRGTTEALRMALATYGLSQLLGGGVGISTATQRNGSASILRRVGGQSLQHREQELPSYHDPSYGCAMEVLRFYSWAPNARYADWTSDVKSDLCNICVFTNGIEDSRWNFRQSIVPGENWCDTTTVQHFNSRSSFVS